MPRTRKFLLLLGLVAIATGLGASYLLRKPAKPSADELARAALLESPEIRALTTAKDALSHAERVIGYDSLRLQGSGPLSESASPVTAEQGQQHITVRNDHLKQLGEARTALQDLSRDAQAKPLAIPAIALSETVRELAAVHEKIFAALDAGQQRDSPASKALLEQAATLEAAYHRQRQPLLELLKAALIKAHESGLPSCGTR